MADDMADDKACKARCQNARFYDSIRETTDLGKDSVPGILKVESICEGQHGGSFPKQVRKS